MPSTMETKDRLKELHKALEAQNTEADRISASWTVDEETKSVSMTTEQHAAYAKAIDEGEKIQNAIMLMEKSIGLHAFGNGVPAGAVPVAAADAAEQAAARGYETKTLFDRFKESDGWQHIESKNFQGEPHASASFDMGIADKVQVKDVYSTMAGDVAINALGHPENLGLTRRVLRPGRVRDLFPKATTTANLLYGIRETGFINRAAIVPERRAADGVSAPTGGPSDVYGLKPRSELSITPITYPVATIAHVMYAHRNTLADEPRIRDLIDTDLVDGVKLVEDYQLLYGDGIGDNLTGLINTPGIQTYTGLSADPRTAQIRRAITRGILAFFPPSGIVLHPLDWEDLELERDNTGAYRLVMNVAVGAEKRLWRLNVVDTVAINQGQYLLGSFGQGAKVYDRESVTLAISTENRDMFERNAVTIRGEERLALVVDRPESFVLGTITTPA
uniref:phage major capsid protein n=1 Tax=Nonomuraea sp. CA-251285 TaxID=3240002 RepID=UPI003F496087